MNIDRRTILISDPTLRDGNHAVSHQLSVDQIKKYCKAADVAGVPIVEVGHGNGLGASSMQVGLAKVDDKTILKVIYIFINSFLRITKNWCFKFLCQGKGLRYTGLINSTKVLSQDKHKDEIEIDLELLEKSISE